MWTGNSGLNIGFECCCFTNLKMNHVKMSEHISGVGDGSKIPVGSRIMGLTEKEIGFKLDMVVESSAFLLFAAFQ